jgi:hypothetical protein
MAGLPTPKPQQDEDLDSLFNDDDDLFGERPQRQQQQQHGAGIPGYLVLPPQRNVGPVDPFGGLPFGAAQQHGAGIAALALPPRPQQHAGIAGLALPRPQQYAGMGDLLARFEQDVDLAGLIAQQPAATAPETATTPVAQAHPDEYPCVECSEHFASVDDRAAHIRTAHNIEDGFLCHECTHSCSDRMQYFRHADEHSASRRRGQYPPPCRSVKCEYRSFSTDVLDRHRREDHTADDSHQAQCSRPECTYSNDSIVGVLVHILHVHSEAAVANRKLAAERKRNEQMFASRRAAAARKAALREAAARAAASDASSDTVPSSPIESIEGTGDNASSATAGPSSKKRPLSPEEQERADEAAANSNAFLEAQMAAHKSQTPEELEQFGLNSRSARSSRSGKRRRRGRSSRYARSYGYGYGYGIFAGSEQASHSCSRLPRLPMGEVREMSTYLFSFGRETALTFSFCTFIPGTKCSNQDMGIAWHGMAWRRKAYDA